MENRIQPFNPSPEKIEQMLAAQNRVPVQFTLYTGNAGNGKSEMLARHILIWFAWTEERGTFEECYSTLHVKTPDWWEGKPRETKDLELTDLAKSIQNDGTSEEIDGELNKMHDCMIAIDEGQNWADRQNWQSVKSRLFNYILMQRRHQHFHIAMTIQDRNWLNRRTDYQIDFEVICQSMHRFKHKDDFTDWEKLPGQYIWTRIRDLSGLVRPYSYYEDHYEKRMRIGPMWPFWDCYSTYQNQDVFDPFRKLTIKSKNREYDLDGNNTNGDNIGDAELRPSINTNAEQVCVHVLNQCLNAGYEMITCNDFRDMCSELGLNEDPARIGRILAKYQVSRKTRNGQQVYDLRDVPVREAAAA